MFLVGREIPGDVMGSGKGWFGRFLGPTNGHWVEGGLFQPIWLLSTGLIFVDAPAKNERMNVPLKKGWDWKTILSLFKI